MPKHSIYISNYMIHKHEECNLELFLLKWLVFVPHMILSKHHYLVVKPATTSLHKSLIFQPYLLDHQRKLILVVGRNFMNIKMMGNKTFRIIGLYFFPFYKENSAKVFSFLEVILQSVKLSTLHKKFKTCHFYFGNTKRQYNVL